MLFWIDSVKVLYRDLVVKEKCTKERKGTSGVNNLLQITNVWTAKNNSIFFLLSARSGDSKVGIFVARFMGTLIYVLCSVSW